MPPTPNDISMFVPDDFEPPTSLVVSSRSSSDAGQPLRLEPLGLQHNERDYRAWTSSIAHIRSSPGFAGRRWPQQPNDMTLADNARDLAAHADDFAARSGFTYTVLDDDDEVVGCVYIYPDDEEGYDAHVRSWVRADYATLDVVLRAAVAGWLEQCWPFGTVRYEGIPS